LSAIKAVSDPEKKADRRIRTAKAKSSLKGNSSKGRYQVVLLNGFLKLRE
jgi:hypothetical protein